MPIIPARLQKINYTNNGVAATWDDDDGTGDPFIGFPYQWNATLIVTAQPTSYYLSSPPFYWDGTAVQIGDWISTDPSGAALQIISISSQDGTNVECVLEDVERFNTFSDPTQSGNGSISDGDGILFTTGEDGLPVLSPLPTGGYLPSEIQSSIISRFSYRNSVINYRSVFQNGNTLAIGDAIYIDNTGTYFAAQADNIDADKIVGHINTINTPGIGWFTWTPNGKIVNKIDPVLPGNIGDLIYSSPITPGGKTTTKPTSWSKPIFIQLSVDGTIGLSINRSIDAIQPSGYASQVYHVVDIPARDALTGINVGDQVLVDDSGNGHWTQYIYTLSGYQILVTQQASGSLSNSKTITIDFTSGSETFLDNIYDGVAFVNVEVKVDTAFDGNPIFTVGDAIVNDRLVSNDQIDLSKQITYIVDPDYQYNTGGSDTPVNVYFSSGGATVGSATVTISYL